MSIAYTPYELVHLLKASLITIDGAIRDIVEYIPSLEPCLTECSKHLKPLYYTFVHEYIKKHGKDSLKGQKIPIHVKRIEKRYKSSFKSVSNDELEESFDKLEHEYVDAIRILRTSMDDLRFATVRHDTLSEGLLKIVALDDLEKSIVIKKLESLDFFLTFIPDSADCVN